MPSVEGISDVHGGEEVNRIAAPLEISKPMHHIAKRDTVTEIKQPLASLFCGVALRSDAGDDLAARGDLQLLAGLDPL